MDLCPDCPGSISASHPPLEEAPTSSSLNRKWRLVSTAETKQATSPFSLLGPVLCAKLCLPEIYILKS